MKKINCAVIGVGYLGKFHAEKYTKLSNIKLIGVCDFDTNRAEEIAKLYQVSAYNDYRQLIGKVDAVSIAATTSMHYEIAKFFLENKVHVLVEKPITTTVAEAKELIVLAHKNKVILQAGHLEHFNPAFVALDKYITAPQLITASRLAPYKPRGNDVSVVLDLMTHDLELVQHLVKAEIKNIKAHTATLISPTPDVASAYLEFENGCIANLTASRLSPHTERSLTVVQNDGYFFCNLDNKTLTINRKDNASTLPATVSEKLTFEKGDALLDEITAFVDAIVNHKSPLVSGEDGARALETALQIEKKKF